MKIIFLLLASMSLSAFAQKRELLVRASDRDGFPAAAMCFFSNNKMVPHGTELLVHYTCMGGEDIQSEIWLVGKTARKLFTSTSGNLFNTPVSVGKSVYSIEFHEGGSVKLWHFDGANTKEYKVPAHLGHIHDFAPLSETKLWMRATTDGINGELEWENGEWRTLNTRGVSYFFGAGYSPKMLVQKVRMGAPGETGESQPDSIQVRLAPDFQPVTVVSDRDGDAASNYKSFRNFSVVTGDYWTVTASTDKGDVALIGHGTNFKEVPLYLFFSTLDFWPPALTSNGELIVRGTHRDGRVGLWIMRDGPELVLTLGDTVTTDLGLATIGETLFYNAPVTNGERIFIGVGLTEFGGRTSLGQGILGLSIK